MEGSVINNNESKVSFEGDNWTLPTDITLLEPATEALIKKLDENGWDKDSPEVADIEIGFKEALVNAIAHGNLGIKKPEGGTETIFQLAQKKQKLFATGKKVRIDLEINNDKVTIKISDEGNGFNINEVTNPKVEGLMSESGRGILLMRTMYFDSVTYDKERKEMILVKERKK